MLLDGRKFIPGTVPGFKTVRAAQYGLKKCLLKALKSKMRFFFKLREGQGGRNTFKIKSLPFQIKEVPHLSLISNLIKKEGR